jgi:hypothetical protein
MPNSVCKFSSVGFSFSYSAYDGDYEIIPIYNKLTAPMVVIRYSKRLCACDNSEWGLMTLRKLLQHVNSLLLTFKNRASYTWDRSTATLQMLHFIYISQQI